MTEGTWVRMHRYAKRAYDFETFFLVPYKKFLELREDYRKALDQHKAKTGETWWFGFLPATFARDVLIKHGIPLTHELFLQYALYQGIQHAPGTYEEGPSAPYKTAKTLLDPTKQCGA